MNSLPLITLLTFTPLIGALVVVGLPAARARLSRGVAAGFSLVALVWALALCGGFDRGSGALQFVERHAWIPSLGVEYFVGVDGLGLVLVLLSALLVPLALAASGGVRDRVPLYQALVLFLQSGLFGAFTALNFFHWFLFWELSLIPAFLLIRFWGGAGRAGAATQFFVYTMVGSVGLLLAFLATYLATGTFDFVRLAELGRTGELASAYAVKLGWYGLSKEQLALVIFLGAFLGFAVKVPVMPFHTWLPQTYAEAPTPVTMLLTGAMSKLGVYGFVRVLLPIFPEQLRAVEGPLLWLAALTVVAGAAAAVMQRDLKRMLAYSSVNHLGYCVLAVVAAARFTGNDERLEGEKVAALNGVVLQMFNHGLTAATLFLFLGWLEQRGEGRRGIDDFGGLRQVMPVFCGLMGIAVFSSLGLPGLNGFVGEFLIFRGSFALAPGPVAVSALGLLITAVFLLTLLQRVFNGPLNERWRGMPDLSVSELWRVGPAVALMVVLGVYPQLLVGLFNATVAEWVTSWRL